MTKPTNIGDRLRAFDRASRVTENLDVALGHLSVAEEHLTKALADAKEDYQYNDQDILNLIGAVRVARMTLIVEQDEWAGYKQARGRVL